MFVSNVFLVVVLIAALFILFKICFEYKGFNPAGDYFAEVYLTGEFGSNVVMWRQRFNSLEFAEKAGQQHSEFLARFLPKERVVNLSDGSIYKKTYDYAVNFRVGQCNSRPEYELTPLNHSTLRGCVDESYSNLSDSNFYSREFKDMHNSRYSTYIDSDLI